jgi:regulatory protein
VAQLRARLGRARFEPAIIEQALAELHETRHVDDRRYAQRFAEDRRRLDGWGSERIRMRLEAAGVERELIDAALAERSDDGELNAAIDLLRVRLAAPPDDDRARTRALGLLVRRGYESELAYEAIRRYGSEAA